MCEGGAQDEVVCRVVSGAVGLVQQCQHSTCQGVHEHAIAVTGGREHPVMPGRHLSCGTSSRHSTAINFVREVPAETRLRLLRMAANELITLEPDPI